MLDLFSAHYDLKPKLERLPEDENETRSPAGERILNGGEYAHVEAGVRGTGEYGHDWDFQRTRIDCKYIIEFMLNYTFSPVDCNWLTENIPRFQFEGEGN